MESDLLQFLVPLYAANANHGPSICIGECVLDHNHVHRIGPHIFHHGVHPLYGRHPAYHQSIFVVFVSAVLWRLHHFVLVRTLLDAVYIFGYLGRLIDFVSRNIRSYMMSNLFESASIGSVSTVIVFLMTYMPYIILVALSTIVSTGSKIFAVIYAWNFQRSEFSN